MTRWFYIDGVLTPIHGSERTIKEQIADLEREHSRVKPARQPDVPSIASYARASQHRHAH